MLKFSSPTSDDSKQCIPNLLPCRINHNGPVDASQRYWAPGTADDEKPEAYFRGRKLEGKEIKAPTGYKGVIVKEAKEEKDADKKVGKQNSRDGEDLGEEGEISMLQEMGSFDQVVLWSHESTVEDEDPFVKGMEEWIGFAEAVGPGSPADKYLYGTIADVMKYQMHKPGKSDGPG